jgi:hypothetical protein
MCHAVLVMGNQTDNLRNLYDTETLHMRKQGLGHQQIITWKEAVHNPRIRESRRCVLHRNIPTLVPYQNLNGRRSRLDSYYSRLYATGQLSDQKQQLGNTIQ